MPKINIEIKIHIESDDDTVTHSLAELMSKNYSNTEEVIVTIEPIKSASYKLPVCNPYYENVPAYNVIVHYACESLPNIDNGTLTVIKDYGIKEFTFLEKIGQEFAQMLQNQMVQNNLHANRLETRPEWTLQQVQKKSIMDAQKLEIQERDLKSKEQKANLSMFKRPGDNKSLILKYRASILYGVGIACALGAILMPGGGAALTLFLIGIAFAVIAACFAVKDRGEINSLVFGTPKLP